jgi:hypothetical protein
VANHQVMGLKENNHVDKRRTASAGNSAGSPATPANYASVGAMRTRLTAISATSYSASRLDAMTINDMEYALRLNDDPTGI